MEKQIEEMAKVLGEIQEFGINRPRDEERYPVLYPSNKEVADYLISKGYRRASEVAREIFEEIERVAMSKIDADLSIAVLNDTYYIEAIDDLKEKYESEEEK